MTSTADRREMLLKEYAEVANAFRLLTDIRFKLLAFLPLAAGAAAAVATRADPPDATMLGFSLFGFAVTVGLVTYNARNDQLYGTLVARAAAIERQLGDPDGVFANRPQAWLRLKPIGWTVSHSTGVNSIYYASIALWLFGVLDSLVRIGHEIADQSPEAWTHLAALGGAILLTTGGALTVKRQRTATQRRLRDYARRAVEVVSVRPLVRLNDTQVVDALEKLEQLGTSRSSADPSSVQRRVTFLTDSRSEDPALYVGRGIGTWHAAQVVAYLTDFAPEWIYDCATCRR